MISFQTNIPSLTSQNNLRINNEFQGRTITRLTSGYRINSSGDDAAGLAIANSYRTFISEVSQGVRNANDGLSTLQIVDGGLANVTRILDRLKSLATQSASGTFQGDRGTLNDEYQSLLNEIDAQANKVGLGSGAYGGRFNQDISVYVGGAGTDLANAKVTIDLSGSANRVDSSALGLAGTSVDAGGNTVLGSKDLRAGQFLTSSATQTFTFNITDASGINTDVAVTVSGLTATGITGAEATDQLNSSLRAYGIQASVDSDTGKLTFSGSVGFNVSASSVATSLTTDSNVVSSINDAMYQVTPNTGTTTAANVSFTAIGTASTAATQYEELTFFVGNESRTVKLDYTNANSITGALTALNAELNDIGIYAVKSDTSTTSLADAITFQSLSTFDYSVDNGSSTVGIFQRDIARSTASQPIDQSGIAASAENAIAAIDNAVVAIGLVQGKVGTSQNRLSYAIDLAESQISSYSAAEARIRDADIASEAANLTKAQVMQQASIAALAQANAVPQALLALLRG